MKKTSAENEKFKKSISDKVYMIKSVIETLEINPLSIVQNINSVCNSLNIPKIFAVLVNIGYLVAIVDICVDETDDIEIQELYVHLLLLDSPGS